MQIWTNGKLYFVLLSNGETYSLDREGNRHGWSYTGEHVGRSITLTDLPPGPRALVALAERRASRDQASA